MKYINKLLLALVLFAMAMVSSANQLTPEFVFKEGEYSHSQYLNGSPETAKYALEAFARLLQSDQSKALLDEIGPNALAMTYARLGVLHEKLGNNTTASDYKAKAVGIFQAMDKRATWEGIKKYLDVLDSPRS